MTPTSTIQRLRLAVLAAACAAVMAALSGCSAAVGISMPQSARTPLPQGVSAPAPSVSVLAVPEFAGPWAEELASDYRKASSDFERGVLADGHISDAEFAETQNRLSTCLSGKSIEFLGFASDGTLQFKLGKGMSSDVGIKIANDCSASSGDNSIGTLYFAMKRNPQNLANNLIISQCMAEKGAVPPGYSAKDYDRDAPNATFPFTNKKTGPRIFKECSADPLGVLDSK